MSGIKKYFIDKSLLSENVDTLRDTLGGKWSLTRAETGAIADSQASITFIAVDNSDMSSNSATGKEIQHEYVSSFITDNSRATTSSADLAIPSVKFPVRIVANEQNVFHDLQWKAIVIGGMYGTSSYPGIYSNGRYQQSNFSYECPYSPIYLKNIAYDSLEDYTTADFTYDYNFYVQQYQNKIKVDNNFLLIPNYYDLLNHAFTPSDDQISPIVNQYISMRDSVETSNIFSPVATNIPPEYDVTAKDIKPLYAGSHTFLNKRQNIKSYLTGNYAVNNSPQEIKNAYSSLSSNLYINKKTQQELFDLASDNEDLFPYYVKLNIPYQSHDGTSFFQMIEDSGYENLMLNQIKENFVENVNALEQKSYGMLKTEIALSQNSFSAEQQTKYSTEKYRCIDLYKMVLQTLAGSNLKRNSNFNMPGNQKHERKKIINNDGLYRFNKVVSSLKFLEHLNTVISLDPVYSPGAMTAERFLDSAEKSRYSEILAYRIEKQEQDTNIKQNFYISRDPLGSTSARDKFTIYDNQVAYGKTYNYNTYAYVVVYGYEYQYSDLVITKQIANSIVKTESYIDADTFELGSTDTLAHCLQFYNPYTGDSADKLVYNNITDLADRAEEYEGIQLSSGAIYPLEDLTEETIAALTTPPLGLYEIETFTRETVGLADNELFNNSQMGSYNKFLADFNIIIEPMVKLIEIPVFDKSITVTDHMPSTLEVYPYQHMDNSNTIGFLINKDAFTPVVYPEKIIPRLSGLVAHTEYLSSNNMILGDKTSLPSRSKGMFIEVYRKMQKPNSTTNFARSDLLEVKTLMDDEKQNLLSNIICEHKILANKKYYYTFRLINENYVAGPHTNVYEVELVDDGGYKYILSKEFTDLELDTPNTKEPSLPIKKLLQLVPNINQLKFNDSAVDYNKSAASQVSNIVVGNKEDNIFNKIFKLRLTSKKTGKKIDLNVSYKLTDQ